MAKLAASTIAHERCVLLIGMHGSGKSTIANHVVGHDPLSPHQPPFEVSQQPLQLESVTSEVKDEIVEFTSGRRLYRVRVIDTIGLFHTDVDADDQDLIFEEISEYFEENDLPGINLILFVFKKGRFTAEEKQVFKIAKKYFQKDSARISALAVTGCENDSPKQREEFIEHFEEDSTTSKIARRMKMGIYPVGFPPLGQMRRALHPVYKPVMERDRQMLRDLIIRAEKPLLTRKLFEGRCTIA